MTKHVPRSPGGPCTRGLRVLAATLLVVAGGRAAAGEIRISWEKDLAFEWDRANYEKTLRDMVQASEAEVSAWLGWPRTRTLEVRVITRPRYEAQFGDAMAWNTGAHYSSGAIHVNGGARLDGWFAGC